MNIIPEKPKGSVRFLHISDTHLWSSSKYPPYRLKGHNPDPWQVIWQSMDNYCIDSVLWSGDVATASDSDAYKLSMQPAGPLSLPARVRTTSNGIKVYSVPGNHDYIGSTGRFPIRTRNQTVFAKCFQPMPGPDVHLFKANDLTIVIFRVDSSSGEVSRFDYCSGKIHKLNLQQISTWQNLAKKGGEVDGKHITPDDLLKSWNILLMHHELGQNDLDADSREALLKFIAAIPIHIVACGHLHRQEVSTYKLFGGGRLNRNQVGYLYTRGLLRTEDVLISRSGTACCTDSNEYTACVLEFTASKATIFPLIYGNGTFSLNGNCILKAR